MVPRSLAFGVFSPIIPEDCRSPHTRFISRPCTFRCPQAVTCFELLILHTSIYYHLGWRRSILEEYCEMRCYPLPDICRYAKGFMGGTRHSFDSCLYDKSSFQVDLCVAYPCVWLCEDGPMPYNESLNPISILRIDTFETCVLLTCTSSHTYTLIWQSSLSVLVLFEEGYRDLEDTSNNIWTSNSTSTTYGL